MMVNKLNQLRDIIRSMGRVTVAVSGGVDSMTLAYIAHQTLGTEATMVHASSPAVPCADTAVIQDHAAAQGWQLQIIQSGEFNDSHYRNNPANRCYFCKSCLYSSLTQLHTGQVISGTNTDDLSDYRPGLIAAKEHDIRHPFVEADIDKQTIRDIAAFLGLKQLAVKPASPCLASRVETGVRIEPKQLHLINDIETQVRSQISAENIRCRIAANQLELQIDASVLYAMPLQAIQSLEAEMTEMVAQAGISLPVAIGPYIRGSAFLRNPPTE